MTFNNESASSIELPVGELLLTVTVVEAGPPAINRFRMQRLRRSDVAHGVWSYSPRDQVPLRRAARGSMREARRAGSQVARREMAARPTETAI
jgi:hypothetical protein